MLRLDSQAMGGKCRTARMEINQYIAAHVNDSTGALRSTRALQARSMENRTLCAIKQHQAVRAGFDQHMYVT